MRSGLGLSVLLLLAFAAGLATADVLSSSVSARAPLVLQTILSVLVLFMLFRVQRAQRDAARDVQRMIDATRGQLTAADSARSVDNREREDSKRRHTIM
jgi:hypothetical protein